MRDVQAPARTPGEEMQGHAHEFGAGELSEGMKQAQQQDRASNPGQTVEELLEDRAVGEATRAGSGSASSAPNTQVPDPPERSLQQPKGSPVPGRGLNDPPRRSLHRGTRDEYQRYVDHHQAEISQLHRTFERLVGKQTRTTPIKSHRVQDEEPDGDIFDRLSIDKHADLMMKDATGQAIEDHDYQRFHSSKDKKLPVHADIVLLIDGSDSMYRGTNGSPIQAGLSTSVIVNEAVRGLPINHEAWLWGNEKPQCLVGPGDHADDIAQRIAGMARPQSWDTQLAPAIAAATDGLATGRRRQPPNALVGNSHFIVVSDGDLMDPTSTRVNLERLLKSSRKVSVDIVVIRGNESPMEQLAKELSRKYPGQVKSTRTSDVGGATGKLLEIVEDRLQETGRTAPIEIGKKRRTMKQAHTGMITGKDETPTDIRQPEPEPDPQPSYGGDGPAVQRYYYQPAGADNANRERD